MTRNDEKKDLKSKLKTILLAERTERETQKEWKQAYKSVREMTLEINESVSDGDTTPKDGVAELKKFVADFKYVEETTKPATQK